MMMNPTVVEALYSATYVEDFIDACENLPGDIQRHLSRMRELDATVQGHMRDAEAQMEILMGLLDKEDKESENAQKEIHAVSWRLQQILICTQEIGDDKLQIAQQVQDFVDNKARQLDLDKKNLDMGRENNESQEAPRETKQHDPPERSTIIKRARRARHEVFVPSILGPSTLAATRFTSEDQKGGEKADACRSAPPTSEAAGPSAPVQNPVTVAKSEAATPVVAVTPPKPVTSTAPVVPPAAEKKVVEKPIISLLSLPCTSERAAASVASAAIALTSMKHETKKQLKKEAAEAAEKKKYKKRKAKQADNSPPNIPIDPDEPTYCLCDQVSYGEMIGCDNDLCPIEWFHFSCVTLTTKPKGKWYCPKCRGDRPNIMKPKAIFLKELEKYNREKEEKA